MAQFIKIYPDNPNPKEIAKVVKVLKEGGLVIYPTDTVYGLGCDITNVKAVEKVASSQKNYSVETLCGLFGKTRQAYYKSKNARCKGFLL